MGLPLQEWDTNTEKMKKHGDDFLGKTKAEIGSLAMEKGIPISVEWSEKALWRITAGEESPDPADGGGERRQQRACNMCWVGIQAMK